MSVADTEIMHEVLEKYTANQIANGSGVSLSTVQKLKSGTRDVMRLNLADAIKLTEFGRKNSSAVIEIYTSNL